MPVNSFEVNIQEYTIGVSYWASFSTRTKSLWDAIKGLSGAVNQAGYLLSDFTLFAFVPTPIHSSP
ncbi:MAG: hypothetical protein JO316_24415 [Abitibacteriaceae bacterium]|nr:hypothetical protein [Abditibacteriaceae bacterium]MBV9868512.1 hypothetical protein [Abditibacteriaceae bacterium]